MRPRRSTVVLLIAVASMWCVLGSYFVASEQIAPAITDEGWDTEQVVHARWLQHLPWGLSLRALAPIWHGTVGLTIYDNFPLFASVALPVSGLVWATLITAAFAFTRRIRERRAASKGV